MSKEVSPPTVLAVSMAEAKQCLRIEPSDTSLDTQIAIWIAGITAEAEHKTGRAFVNRPMRVTLDWIDDTIQLGRPPLFSVESVQFVGTDGALQTLDPSDYTVDAESEPGYLVPAPGTAWPETADQVNAVAVNYTAGYGPDETTVPRAAKLYVLARLAELFDPAAREFKETHASQFVGGLLDSLKVYG